MPVSEHKPQPRRLFSWSIHGDGRTVAEGAVVAPDERLSWPLTIGLGAQHVVAMFGATFLVPLLTGFPPSTTLLFSGIGTLLFLVITKNRVPSYLGSSFAFISPITAAATGESPAAALGAVMLTGAALALVGIVVQKWGSSWINALMPPVVMGAVVALIGFNLAGTVKANYSQDAVTATITLAAIVLSTVLFRGMLGRVSILLGVAIGYAVAVARGLVDFADVAAAAWIGLPEFQSPEFHVQLLPMFLPVVLVLVAENVGHVKSVAQMTGRNLDDVAGKALFADGAATMLAAAGGGSPTTTYGENIGVMAATRVYSTAAYWIAGGIAILLSLSPKFGALLFTVPPGVLGGVTAALYGLIGIIGVRMWVDSRVDFSDPVNQLTAGVALIIGIADFEWIVGDIEMRGIALGTLACVIIFHAMRGVQRLRRDPSGRDAEAPAAEGSGLAR